MNKIFGLTAGRCPDPSPPRILPPYVLAPYCWVHCAMVNRNFGLMGQNRQWGLGRRHPPRHSDQPIAIWGWRPNLKKNPKINLPNCSIFGFSLKKFKKPHLPNARSVEPGPLPKNSYCTLYNNVTYMKMHRKCFPLEFLAPLLVFCVLKSGRVV